MARVAIFVGLILIAIGVAFYIGTGGKSITAMIPAFVGLPLAICGFVALNDLRRKAAMHVAVVIALLGFVGSISRAFKLPAALSNAPGAPDPIVAYESAALNVLCLVFIILAVRFFIDARKTI